MIFLPSIFALVVAVVLSGDTASTQEVSHHIADGRTVSVTMSTPSCDDQNAGPPDDRFAINLVYGCGAVGSGVDGEGTVLVSHEPGQTTPRQFLMSHVADLLPEATDEERQSQITMAEFLSQGVVVQFLCFTGENADRTGGRVYCVLDQPNTQVVVGAESYDRDKAVAVLQLILGGMTIR